MYEESKADNLIELLYRKILRRDPDAVGFAAFRDALLSGQMDLGGIIETLLSSDEFRRNFARDNHGLAGPFNETSQNGEISLLLRKMIDESSPTKTLVEIGVKSSQDGNSFDLMKWFQWRGILIEANTTLCHRLREEYSGLDFDLVECAVSDYSGRATFHIGTNDAVSSLDPAAALNWGPIRGTISVEVRRLSDILEERGVPADFDFLSVDIEGEDVKVVNDLIENSVFRPRWIMIELFGAGGIKTIEAMPVNTSVKAAYELSGSTDVNVLLRLRALPLM